MSCFYNLIQTFDLVFQYKSWLKKNIIGSVTFHWLIVLEIIEVRDTEGWLSSLLQFERLRDSFQFDVTLRSHNLSPFKNTFFPLPNGAKKLSIIIMVKQIIGETI